MNTDKIAMTMAIIAKVIEDEIFNGHDESTITKKYYRETIIPALSKRATRLIMDAHIALKLGVSPQAASSIIFIEDMLRDVMKNRSNSSKTDKNPLNMTEQEMNDFLDHIKKQGHDNS